MSDRSASPEPLSSMSLRPRQDRVPLAVIALTAAGFLPFAALAAASVQLAPGEQHLAVQAQHIYGAVILSFLGGIYWGWEFATQDRDPVSGVRLSIGVIPSILAWAAVLLPTTGQSSIALALCFVSVLAYDIWRARNAQAPAWYPQLRVPITIAVVLALLLPLVMV